MKEEEEKEEKEKEEEGRKRRRKRGREDRRGRGKERWKRERRKEREKEEKLYSKYIHGQYLPSPSPSWCEGRPSFPSQQGGHTRSVQSCSPPALVLRCVDTWQIECGRSGCSGGAPEQLGP